MKIQCDWFVGKYPSFNVSLSTTEGKEPYLVIKGCRLVSGSRGEFVSWPANKKPDGSYWNHVHASEAFATAVLQEAQRSKQPTQKSRPSRQAPVDDDGLPPF